MTKTFKENSGMDGTAIDTATVLLSRRFIVLSLLSSILVAFAIGQIAGIFITKRLHMELNSNTLADDGNFRAMQGLPNPVVKEGKVGPPSTKYSAKYFDTARSEVNSRWITTNEGEQACPSNDKKEGEASCRSLGPDSLDIDEDESEHLPQGQHLLMDIENVNTEFLDSEELLAHAMLELVDECGLTLLSYHCHGLQPSGVSCAGVLLESHVSFHTWPLEGVITLDLFTCGDQSLLPIVPIAEKLFSISRPGSIERPHIVWSHKIRGFHDDVSGESEFSDFFGFPIGVMTEYKQKILSDETKFQRIDVYDVLVPNAQTMETFQRSLLDDGSYEATHPKFFAPDRIVFLDGVMQSRRSGDAAYHEALVHPAMFAHSNPKRVAIIGGGEGATLREVLKHNTVEKVVMIEIDEMMVSLSREYLPEWNDCSILKGSTDSCFDDPRVEMYYEDAFAWFIDRYGGENHAESFDVIIMDALDPQIQIAFVEALYDGGPFLQSLPDALDDDGMFIAQVGEGPQLRNPPEEFTIDKNRDNFFRNLGDLGFEAVRDYEEMRGGFLSPWQFVVAFKDSRSVNDWLDSPAVISRKMRARTIPTVEGKVPLFFYDGPAMVSYHYPSKASEVVFCRSTKGEALCANGHGFDPEKTNLSSSALELHSGRVEGEFSIPNETSPYDTYIDLEAAIYRSFISSKAFSLILAMGEKLGTICDRKHEPHSWWLNGIHRLFVRRGVSETVMFDPTFVLFLNHFCNSSEIGKSDFDPSKNQAVAVVDAYNPVSDRQVQSLYRALPFQNLFSNAPEQHAHMDSMICHW